MRRVLACMAMTTLAAISCGCKGPGVSAIKKTPPGARPMAKDATREELVDTYNALALGVKSVNATVELKPTAGSKYSGVIEEYHEVKAFLLAARPSKIRVIGQVPVIGKTVFDMASDGETFRVWIPSKNKFLVGPISLERPSEKPIENLRPQHLLDALLWQDIKKEEAVLFEEYNDENARYYILTVLRGGYRSEILRKIWFDRADLHVARLQNYGPKGVLVSDIRVSDWQAVDVPAAAASGTASGGTAPTNASNIFPRNISIKRPHDDYRLDLQVTKITLNEDLSADRFKLEQPSGSELVRVGDNAEGKQP
jgi:hypothetical protein